MNTRTLILTVTIPVLALAGLTALAAERQASGAEPAKEKAQEKALRAQARLEQQEKKVRDCLGIAPAMEFELFNGKDPVEELRKSGRIVEASVEEVKAAMEAAASTPETEDDVEALLLRHNASCRFYCDGMSAMGRNQ